MAWVIPIAMKVASRECRPTMRAVDRWVRTAFFELFRGIEFSPFRRRISSHPPAGNADGWAPGSVTCTRKFFGRSEI